MNKIIPLDKTYEFVFVEDKVNIQHPVSNYYMKLDDLSINLVINLKWINWGYYFLTSIKEELDLLKKMNTLLVEVIVSINNQMF